MAYEPNLSLRRARRTGAVMCALALGLGGLFVYGLLLESYWVLAVPVAAGVGLILSLAFLIGYTINTVKGIPEEADHYEGRAARWIAAGICVASVAAAAVFALFVWRQSYWALAIPVGIAVLGLLWMVFLIGWAIVTQRSTLPADANNRPADANFIPEDTHPVPSGAGISPGEGANPVAAQNIPAAQGLPASENPAAVENTPAAWKPRGVAEGGDG